MSNPIYKTRIKQWKRELSAELERNVTYDEIAEATGIAYSTLLKHANHEFVRPDYGTAARICKFFNERSLFMRTPLDYFEDDSTGQPAAVVAH